MKFSEQWLREWVDPPVSAHELAEQLTMAGLEVECLEACQPGFSGVIVAEIVRIECHPNDDRLSVCQVTTGSGDTTTVVCGAPNVVSGRYYALAPPESILPGNRVIQPVTVKGIHSAGMLCSGAELGLSDENDIILELDSTAQAGMKLQDYLTLNDHIIELSLTPNRGDCLGIHGIAREVGVINSLDIHPPGIGEVAIGTGLAKKITLAAPQACPKYIGRVIEEIAINTVTPVWIKERLRRSGLRSINIIVDITNYVMLELGQPMHAFDIDLLQGDITVRFARSGEHLDLLDGQHCNLIEQTLVIADESGAIAMAGIMGGLNTAVTDKTRNIFLESAFFTPDAIQGKARQYGLHTDSSRRYERGVDFELQQTAMDRASQLIIKYCSGKAGPVSAACEAGYLPVRKPVLLRAGRLEQLLGTRINKARCTEILERLGMEVIAEQDSWQVTPASFRFDINIEVDLIEEIARIYGYNNLPSTDLQSNLRIHQVSDNSNPDKLRYALVSRGYQEAITYSFIDSRLQQLFADPACSIVLKNPISAELGEMRQSLWPGLIMALQHNINRQQQRVRLFEHGRIFKNTTELVQETVISGLCYGNIIPKQWDMDDISCSIYDIKSDVEALIAELSSTANVSYEKYKEACLHPGRAAEIYDNNQLIGVMGAIHPEILKVLDIPNDVYVFELYLSRISPKIRVKFTKLSKFPSIRRDISILLDESIPVAQVFLTIIKCTSQLLENLELFDVYQGEGIDLEKKSLALGLTFQGTSSTLTDKIVEEQVQKVLTALNTEFGATLRE